MAGFQIFDEIYRSSSFIESLDNEKDVCRAESDDGNIDDDADSEPSPAFTPNRFANKKGRKLSWPQELEDDLVNLVKKPLDSLLIKARACASNYLDLM